METETLHGFERATQIEPDNARNWYLLGRYLQYSFEDANPQRAISSYIKSLEIDPRATSTWLELAATYESEGNDVAARKAFVSAEQTYPLSAEVSWRYGNFLLRQGELEPAFAEIRRSVEADPGRAAEAVSRCLRVEPDANVILDRVLPANSDIYIAVMEDLAQDRQIDNALKVWTRIVAMHPRIPLHDAFQVVMDLRGTGQASEAHKVWEQAVELAGLAELEGPKNSMVWDGGFESDVTGGEAYAWRFARTSRSAQIGFDTQEKYSGKRSLRVSFDGSSDVSFYDVCQVVPTEAGDGVRAFCVDEIQGFNDGPGRAHRIAPRNSRADTVRSPRTCEERSRGHALQRYGQARKRIKRRKFACDAMQATRKITRSAARRGWMTWRLRRFRKAARRNEICTHRNLRAGSVWSIGPRWR